MDATATQGGGEGRARRGQRQHSREGKWRAGGGEERGKGAADRGAQTGAGRYAPSWMCRLNSQCDDADVPGCEGGRAPHTHEQPVTAGGRPKSTTHRGSSERGRVSWACASGHAHARAHPSAAKCRRRRGGHPKKGGRGEQGGLAEKRSRARSRSTQHAASTGRRGEEGTPPLGRAPPSPPSFSPPPLTPLCAGACNTQNRACLKRTKSLDAASRHLLITFSSDVLSHSAYTEGAGRMRRGKWGGGLGKGQQRGKGECTVSTAVHRHGTWRRDASQRPTTWTGTSAINSAGWRPVDRPAAGSLGARRAPGQRRGPHADAAHAVTPAPMRLRG